MGYKQGMDKQQLTLSPICIDDMIPAEHICRIISVFTEQLDMVVLGYKYAEPAGTGCNPYDPRMMLNLYIYGYLHRIRSSRRLQAETRRNIEVIWLMEGLAPNDKTICNFRRDNDMALRETFHSFSRMCQKLGLYGKELIAVDGTKVRADNSLKNNYSKTKVERELSRIDKRISEYLNALEQSEVESKDSMEYSAERIEAVIEKLSEKKGEFEELLARIKVEGEISMIDPDARMMRSGGDGRSIDVCYNLQTAVDSKNKMLVDFEVTSHPVDRGYLCEMSKRSKELLEVESITVLADKGYYSGEDIAAAEEIGAACFVARAATGGIENGFPYTDFKYDAENDCYICPCKNKLKYMREQKMNGRNCRVYSNAFACKDCDQNQAVQNQDTRKFFDGHIRMRLK